MYYEPDNEIIAGLVLFENDNGIHTISSGLEYELDKNKANHAIWILSTLHHKIIPVEKWKEDADTVFIQWVINSILSLEETNQITVDGKTVTIVHEKSTSSFSNGHITIIIQY